MPKKIIINLPVKDRVASKSFFGALGLPLNEKLSDDNATCFNIEDNIIIALLPVDHFRETIVGNSVADATTSETLLAIGTESKEAAQDLLDKVAAAGGQEVTDRYDMPEIYAGSFRDLDGHLWNIFYMS